MKDKGSYPKNRIQRIIRLLLKAETNKRAYRLYQLRSFMKKHQN